MAVDVEVEEADSNPLAPAEARPSIFRCGSYWSFACRPEIRVPAMRESRFGKNTSDEQFKESTKRGAGPHPPTR
jgi:hypothetical protein